MKKYWYLLKERLKTETPKWFKKIRTFALWLGGIGGAIIASYNAIPNSVPENIKNIAGYLVVAGVVAAGVASTATNNTSVSKKSEEILNKNEPV